VTHAFLSVTDLRAYGPKQHKKIDEEIGTNAAFGGGYDVELTAKAAVIND
jgi:hypothetical protein